MSQPESALKSAAKNIGKALLVLGLWFGAYLAWLGIETRKVSSFCSELRPGMPVSEIASAGTKHKINPRWLDGVKDDKKEDWFVMVPISATMGEAGCILHHDGHTITSVRPPKPFR